jgi:hypothetical protein
MGFDHNNMIRFITTTHCAQITRLWSVLTLIVHTTKTAIWQNVFGGHYLPALQVVHKGQSSCNVQVCYNISTPSLGQLLLMSTNRSKHWQLGNLETWILWQYHTMVQFLLTVVIAITPRHTPPPTHKSTMTNHTSPICFKISIILI